MTLVYACIAPHGSEVIEKLASKSMAARFRKTREGMFRLAEDVREAKPDCVVIATPHNLRLRGKIGVVIADHSSGRLQASPRNKDWVALKVKCDVGFAIRVLDESTDAGLPVVGANYGTDHGRYSDMPMDWGTLVPLWFLLRGVKAKVVIVTPSRDWELHKNFQFGRIIGRLMERTKRRFVFVASADQAHAHRKSSEFGFSPAAKKYDEQVVKAIQSDRLSSIMRLKHDFVDHAKPDSLWQMTVLAGVLDEVRMRPELVSYQVPTYFGMICAAYHRTRRP